MPAIAARSPARWRPKSPVHELVANTAIIRRAGRAGGPRVACCPNPASGRGACGRHRELGARGARQRYSALCAAGAIGGFPDPRQRLAGAVAIAAGHAIDHARRIRRRRLRRHRLGAGVQPVEVAGIFAVSLCGDPAGHAGDRDRAAAVDLSFAAKRRHRLRLDRRIFSGAVQHHARPQFRGSQSGRPVSALRRLADTDAGLSQAAFGVAVHPWRIADSGRTFADRRGRRRDRRGVGRRGLRIGLSNRGIRLPPQHCQNVRRVAVAVGGRDCHLRAAGANLAPGIAALARERPWKGQLMVAGNISSEKIDLLIYGPSGPILENGFSDQFVLHPFEPKLALERLNPPVAAKIRGAAVTYHTVNADKTSLSLFPRLEIVASFGVGYDHVDSAYAREHNIVVTNTPDVLTEEVADVAMGLLIATVREFVKADRYLRSGLWMTQNYPLSVGSLRDRKVGIVGMGRIGQAIARRLDASRVPVVYHTRNPAKDVSYKHYPDLIEMAKAVDTLVVIVPGGPSTAKMINADVLKALGPRGVIVNVARGSVVDEPALIAALKSGTILAAGLDVFANEPTVPDELRAMQNVVLLPHIGSASVVTRNAMDQLVVDNLKAWFAGKPPLAPIPETPVKGR